MAEYEDWMAPPTDDELTESAMAPEELDPFAAPTSEEMAEMAVPEDLSAMEAFREGAQDIGTFGFYDEAKATALASAEKLGSLLGGEEVDFGKRYEEIRDTERLEQERAAEQHPIAYGAGGVTGAIGGALLTGGAAAGFRPHCAVWVHGQSAYGDRHARR